jgi:hypothetical protein
LGLDKTEELLNEKSVAPYDEVKLREVRRANEELKHKINQAVKDEEEQNRKLIELKCKQSVYIL